MNVFTVKKYVKLLTDSKDNNKYWELFPDLSTVLLGTFPPHVGVEMKQKRHYANIIRTGCQFITH